MELLKDESNLQTIAYLANHNSYLAPPNGTIERSASGFRPEFLSPKHATPDVRSVFFSSSSFFLFLFLFWLILNCVADEMERHMGRN